MFAPQMTTDMFVPQMTSDMCVSQMTSDMFVLQMTSDMFVPQMTSDVFRFSLSLSHPAFLFHELSSDLLQITWRVPLIEQEFHIFLEHAQLLVGFTLFNHGVVFCRPLYNCLLSFGHCACCIVSFFNLWLLVLSANISSAKPLWRYGQKTLNTRQYIYINISMDSFVMPSGIKVLLSVFHLQVSIFYHGSQERICFTICWYRWNCWPSLFKHWFQNSDMYL